MFPGKLSSSAKISFPRTHFLCSSRIPSPTQKALRRQKAQLYKLQDFQKVRFLSSLISKEVKRINSSEASQLLTSCNSRCRWQEILLLCGKKAKLISCTANIESINREFIYPLNHFTVSWVPDECTDATPFSKEEVFELLRSTTITTDLCLDGMSSLILKCGAAALTDVLVSLLKISICKHSIPDCFSPDTIVLNLESGNSGFPDKHLRLIALTLWK